MKDQFFKEIEKATLTGLMKWKVAPHAERDAERERIAEIQPGIFLHDGRGEYKGFVLCTFTSKKTNKKLSSDTIKSGKLASRLQISNRKGETDDLVIFKSKSLVKEEGYETELCKIVEDQDFIDLFLLIHDCIKGRRTLTQLRMKIYKDFLQGHGRK